MRPSVLYANAGQEQSRTRSQRLSQGKSQASQQLKGYSQLESQEETYKQAAAPTRSYSYKYAVADDQSGADFGQSETRDDKGTVQGEYRVVLPDGRTQIVTYRVDEDSGYMAEVRYEGVAHYPKYEPTNQSDDPAPNMYQPSY